MMDTLNRPVLGPVTILHLFVLFIVVMILLPRASKLFGKKETTAEKLKVDKQCMSCGWMGSVSVHNARCPKCAKSLS